MGLMSVLRPVVILGVATIVGAALVPAVIYLGRDDTPRRLRRLLGRIAFVEGQFAYGHGGLLAYLPPSGRYEMLPLRSGDERYVVEYDGDRYDVDPDGDGWTRLGLKRFAAGVLVSEDRVDDLLVDSNGPASDGGVRIVGRDGNIGAIPEREELQISLGKFYDAIDGAGGTTVPQRSKEAALEEYGGDQDLNQWLFVLAFVFCLALGAATGVLVL